MIALSVNRLKSLWKCMGKCMGMAVVAAALFAGASSQAGSEIAVQNSAPSAYDFVQLRISSGDQSASMDDYADLLGRDVIDHLKGNLYSRLITVYPEIKNLPFEKFKEIFVFEVQLNWFTDTHGGFGLALFIDGGIRRLSKSVLKADNQAGAFKAMDTTSGAWIVSLIRLLPAASLTWESLLSKTPLKKLDPARFSAGLSRLVDLSDFTAAIKPGQMTSLLLIKHPELKVYFHLDELLKLAMQNPEALTNHLREEILNAETAIRNLVRQQEITRQEGETRVAEIKKEISALEVGLLDKARRALELDAEIRIKEENLRALNVGVDSIRDQMRTVADLNTVGQRVTDEIRNLELLQTPDAGETVQLRVRTATYVRSYLLEELNRLQIIHREKWDRQKIYIEMSPAIAAPLHDLKTGWTGKKLPLEKQRLVIPVIVTTTVRSPVATIVLTTQLTFTLEGGSVSVDQEVAQMFFREIETSAASVGADFETQGETVESLARQLCRQLLEANGLGESGSSGL